MNLAAADLELDRFHDAHLARVSRSFAFCIPRLEPPFRGWVALSYLLFRVLDTIEDSAWPDAERRERQFDAFDRMLEGDGGVDVAAWIAAFPATTPESERLLIADTPRLLADLHALPPRIAGVIITALHTMSTGMRYFLGRDRGLRLESVGEVDLYCFFVAGLVGEMLTTLFAATTAFPLSDAVLADAHRFGRFLQKINILKDARADRAAGRELAPPQLAASLHADAEGALAYLRRLPVEARGYRLFCAWSMSLAFFTVAGGGRRAEAAPLLSRIESIIDDDAALTALFEQHAASLPREPFDGAPFHAPLPPIRTALSPAALRILGLDLQTEPRS